MLCIIVGPSILRLLGCYMPPRNMYRFKLSSLECRADLTSKLAIVQQDKESSTEIPRIFLGCASFPPSDMLREYTLVFLGGA